MVNRRTAFLGMLLLLAAAPGAAGCGGEEEEAETANLPPEERGEEVPLVRAFPAQTSGGITEPAKEILREAKAFEALWKRANAHIAPVPKAPPVDFGAEMVALVSLGTKPTAGFSVEIVAAREDAGRLRILHSVRAPREGEAVAQVRTAPWHAVVLPRSDLPVDWAEYVPPGRR